MKKRLPLLLLGALSVAATTIPAAPASACTRPLDPRGCMPVPCGVLTDYGVKVCPR